MSTEEFFDYFNSLPINEQRDMALAVNAAYKRNANAMLKAATSLNDIMTKPVIHRHKSNGL